LLLTPSITAISQKENGFEISAGYRFRFLLLLFFAGSMQRKEEPMIQWIFYLPGISSGYFNMQFLFASFYLLQVIKEKEAGNMHYIYIKNVF
jgi:hypothetical protein